MAGIRAYSFSLRIAAIVICGLIIGYYGGKTLRQRLKHRVPKSLSYIEAKRKAAIEDAIKHKRNTYSFEVSNIGLMGR